MFSSRTLAERNNDPEPYEQVYFSTLYEPFSRRATSGGGAAFSPRPEFQHGKLPANAVLTAFRDAIAPTPNEGAAFTPQIAREWLWDWRSFMGLAYGADSFEVALSEIAHAHRVLTLLASLANPESSTHV